jgi:hypothetical protein
VKYLIEIEMFELRTFDSDTILNYHLSQKLKHFLMRQTNHFHDAMLASRKNIIKSTQFNLFF